MKEVINIYKQHKITIDTFIKTLVQSLPKDYISYSKEILGKYRYIQLLYSVDHSLKQKSPVICRRKREDIHIGSDKSHYFVKMILDADSMYISNPYIHYRTGKASLSIVYFIDDTYFVFDLNLIELLEELKLIEYNKLHDKIKRGIYFVGSVVLSLVALILISYGAYTFFALLFVPTTDEFLHAIFKSIIATTLGLAIFDLAKQIFEHEVLFQSFHHPDDKQYKVLGKFLISIVIALSIETLMVVFKIALDDYSKMLSAFYLLLGTTIMFVGLGWFYKTIKESGCKDDD